MKYIISENQYKILLKEDRVTFLKNQNVISPEILDQSVEGEDEKGDVIIYYIKTITDGKVEVDGNHPWAGERINFLAIIEDVRTAKDEEISNKHVQQPAEKKH